MDYRQALPETTLEAVNKLMGKRDLRYEVDYRAALLKGCLCNSQEDLSLAGPGNAEEIVHPGLFGGYTLQGSQLVRRKLMRATHFVHLKDFRAERAFSAGAGYHHSQRLSEGAHIHPCGPFGQFKKIVIKHRLTVEHPLESTDFDILAGRFGLC